MEREKLSKKNRNATRVDENTYEFNKNSMKISVVRWHTGLFILHQFLRKSF